MTCGVGLGLVAASSLSAPQIDHPQCSQPSLGFADTWGRTSIESIRKNELMARPQSRAFTSYLEKHLADYQKEWTNAHKILCERSQTSEHRSPHTSIEGTACLTRQQLRVNSFLNSLETIEREQLDSLIADPDAHIAHLGWPSDCISHSDSRRAQTQTPIIRQYIDSARVFLASSDAPAAHIRMNTATELANTYANHEALAEVLQLRALEHFRGMELPSAESIAVQAFISASKTNNSHTELQATLLLIEILAMRNKTSTGEIWYRHASEIVDKIERPGQLEAELNMAQFHLARETKDYKRAKKSIDAAIRISTREGASPSTLEHLELKLAHLLADDGEIRSAIDRYRSVRYERSLRLGEGHPQVAILDYDIGFALLDTGEHQAAAKSLHLALDSQVNYFGSQPPRLHRTMIKLAEAKYFLHEFDEAESLANNAWELESIHLEVGDPGWLDAPTIIRAIQSAKFDYAKLIDFNERLLSQYGDRMTSEQHGQILYEIAWTQCRIGKFETAAYSLNQARRLVDEETLLDLDIIEAELHIERGEMEAARKLLNAITPSVRSVDHPETQGYHIWLLARVCEKDSPDDARTYAHNARMLFTDKPPPDIDADLERLSSI